MQNQDKEQNQAISRPIRFRAWLTKEKEWYNLDITDSSSVGVLNVNFDYILCQFTGLLDKNGKEIYEGDIIVVRELHDGDDDAWLQPTGPAIPCVVKWDDKYKKIDFGGCSRIIFSPSHFEVIGNVWENPELVKS